MNDATDAIFRRYPDGDIIALFPGLAGDPDIETCSSYMHIGQHGSAHISAVMRQTRAAKPEEYAALQKELEGVPYEYKLVPIKRATRAHRRARETQLR